MHTLPIENPSHASELRFSEDAFIVVLDDGRSISVPLTWFPRLLNATQDELKNYELIGEGEGIHWPDLDEDISVEGIIAGRRSGENQKSLQRWLEARNAK